jgi:hypothetical protein
MALPGNAGEADEARRSMVLGSGADDATVTEPEPRSGLRALPQASPSALMDRPLGLVPGSTVSKFRMAGVNAPPCGLSRRLGRSR